MKNIMVGHGVECVSLKRIALLVVAVFVAGVSGLKAQSPEWLRLNLDMRGDYQGEYVEGDKVKDNSGFKGKYFLLKMSGNISEHFSYSFRQRLNKPNRDASFFDATDWLYVSYSPTKHWEFSAGKQTVGIGGFEYDRAPIDLYFASEYWNNINCFQWGASAAYITENGKDKIMLQATTSPFKYVGEDLYAYNLMWFGNHGWFSTLYSANMMEYAPGKYISYITLGNQFTMGDFRLQFDFQNRATNEHAYFFKNCSMVGELAYNIGGRATIFGKVSYDVNHTRSVADKCVFPGSEITRVGGGLEFFPIKGSGDVRLHATGGYTFGKNTNLDGTLRDEQAFFNVGATWRVDVISTLKKIIKS